LTHCALVSDRRFGGERSRNCPRTGSCASNSENHWMWGLACRMPARAMARAVVRVQHPHPRAARQMLLKDAITPRPVSLVGQSRQHQERDSSWA
jgi:hypothetical protein